MELIWLEDLVALAEHGGFSRAAERRHVTQPAFSRRIRALEAWMGVALFDRTPQGAVATEAGRHVAAAAKDMTRRLHQIREEAREIAGQAARTLRFAATHSLSFTFFPRWIRNMERGAPLEAVRLQSDSMAECERMLQDGDVQFLLCHRHPDVVPTLPSAQFSAQVIGKDSLLALRAADWHVPQRNIPYLGYTPASGLGRILDARLSAMPPLPLERSFSSHLAAVLMSMALESKGVAWLPASLADQEINEGRLCRAFGSAYDVPLQILLVRPRTALSPFAESFWARLSE
ncbi:LysR family transcriptional regulator [Pseudomonas sp. Marseille-QA0892]